MGSKGGRKRGGVGGGGLRGVSSMSISLEPCNGLSRRQSLLLRFLFAFLLLVLIGFTLFMVIKAKKDIHVLQKQQQSSPKVYTYQIVNVFDHDPQAFTQGLVYGGNDILYESTGLYGASSVRSVELQTGKVRLLQKMASSQFGEGLTLNNERLLQVTWRTNIGFIYNKNTLRQVSNFQHSMGDGWGLATDNESLIGSDGSATIYFIHPTTFSEIKRFTVKYANREVRFLNELEYVNGEIWANIWQSDCIARISPDTGEVLGWVLLPNLRGNLLSAGYTGIDVLNGIAWDKDQDRLFVTGKLWPKLYEIRVNEVSSPDANTASNMCIQ